MIQFMSFASGSSGNCYYVATSRTALLIDAGIGARTIKKYLRRYSISLASVHAVLITHDHTDHIKSAGALGEKYHIPVYTTPAIHAGMNRNRRMSGKVMTAARALEKEVPIELGDFKVTAFEVPHDGTDNVGYFIEAEGKSFCFVTDIGHVTSIVSSYLCKANYLILEANYDEEMLRTGPYPERLKKRIAGPIGHLSNAEAARFLAEHFHEGLEHVWLCHLSKDNNKPELACETVRRTLQEKGFTVGKDVQVTALERTVPSKMYELE